MEKRSFKKSLNSALKSFLSISPMIIAVIMFVGILKTFVTKDMFILLFTKNAFVDTLIGTLIGAVSVGQPIVSYIIGGELLDMNVSMYAVTAFILSWVTLGVVQLPLEIEILGLKFTIYRNILAFFFTLIVSILTVLTLEMLK